MSSAPQEQRLESDSFDFQIAVGPDREPHLGTLSFMRKRDGTVHEVTIRPSGKIGQGLDLIFTNLGIMISRGLQGRDPLTGARPDEDAP